ncbi:hypothetical protein BIW11_07858 [Tropilaelaps mercedesae]|uniref:Sushi domain-containing protein n=1 Tax=Tropilaelaps mercedesae TaxID=418985 RepID=A0A1V9XS38_9ACAR|nr:hypothetical protein BIW11_07858 [Tropilaelaps mercedesae]
MANSPESSATSNVSCGGKQHEINPPLFVQMVQEEAHFRCASGYQLIGRRIVTCTILDQELPSCRELPKKTITSDIPTPKLCLWKEEESALEDTPTSAEDPAHNLPLILKREARPVSPKRPLPFPEQFEKFFSSPKTTEFEPVAKALQQRNSVRTSVKFFEDVLEDTSAGGADDDSESDGDWLTEANFRY